MGRDGRSQPIVDRDAMKRVARWAIENRPTSWSRLQEQPDTLGVSRSTLDRLRRGLAATVKESTVNRLHRLAYEANRDDIALDLVRATMRETEITVGIQGYHSWLMRRAQRLVCDDGPHWHASRSMLEIVADADVDDPPAGHFLFGGDLAGIPLRRYHDVRALLAHLNTTPPTKGIFDAFDDWMTERGHDEWRRTVAYIRVVEPLLEAPESAYVERQWQEFDDRELVRFIRAGFRRE
jgi:hypothetical protein